MTMFATSFALKLPLARQLQEESSGVPYSITTYVTRANFSVSHKIF